ncbi:AAA family ATPase, partial [Staphylococcus haemolyticus]|uniref:AAA family ATPase n=1 Tax=Staphylococcus haemolyticus TaxID=1283 RepID=UPI0011A8A106
LLPPPPTAKTLLPPAVAPQAPPPFFSITPSHFLQIFLPLPPTPLPHLFQNPKNNPPSIIFIHQIHPLPRQRAARVRTTHHQRQQTLNQL